MTVAQLGYQEIRQAIFSLPRRERLQLIRDAIWTLFSDERVNQMEFDFDSTLSEIQGAFAKVGPLTDQAYDDARYAYLMEKHGP